MKTSHLSLLCSLLFCTNLLSQKAIIKGVILDEELQPVPAAYISTSTGEATETNENGFYLLEVTSGKKIEIIISHISFKKLVLVTLLEEGTVLELNPVLKKGVEQIGEVTLTGSTRPQVSGISIHDPETLRRIPGANAGIENLLKTLPGVSSNNELSTQYSVRGGNFDENLVYVNGIEIYRPFLVRSGQQEGLSFINPELVRNIYFSAGGFQARYGDKLSSVLDINYRRPTKFAASLEAGLLGASLTLEGISNDQKLSAIGSVRYRDNSLFVEAQETETNFQPIFSDVQSYIIYRLSGELELSFLGNVSLNEYNYRPLTRQTNFGTLQDPKALLIYYSGHEEDTYKTYFGALKSSYKLSDNFTAHFILSAHQTGEQEYFDILARYRLGRIDSDVAGQDFGKVDITEGIGAQLTHARNRLQAFIVNAEHKGNLKLENDAIDYGIKITREDIQDRIREYEIIDSAGFSIRPPLADFVNNQPYEPFDAPLEPYTSIRAFNKTQINRIQAYLQWGKRIDFGEHQAWLNLGLRSHSWRITSRDVPVQTVVSPRAQFVFKPAWEKDLLFRISGGLYQQPPFYRELRNHQGEINPEVGAQRAIHLVLGNEYSFRLFERPFKLTSEIYFKDLTDVNTYTLENVRIRYAADNNAEAYAYGFDLRWNGEFVSGTESWLSFGFLKTKENIDNRGYIARPTDQRLKFGLLFQDYVPKVPDLKMYLNLVYNTGLPGGSPTYADPYLYQSRLRDYKRADLGLSYFLVSENSKKKIWLEKFEEVSIGLEIFNLFDIQNSITNTFVRDVYSKVQYAVPNYLTPRVFNFKLGIKL